MGSLPQPSTPCSLSQGNPVSIAVLGTSLSCKGSISLSARAGWTAHPREHCLHWRPMVLQPLCESEQLPSRSPAQTPQMVQDLSTGQPSQPHPHLHVSSTKNRARD